MTELTVIPPATPPADPDVELRRAVAVAYRTVRRRGELDHPAWLAARAEVMRLRPEFSEKEAGDRACSIISWAATEHSDWFWRGVGKDDRA